MIRRTFTAIAALLLTWFGLLAPQHVAAAAPLHAAPTYAYDGQCAAEQFPEGACERGPPAQAPWGDYNALDRSSHSTSVRLDGSTARATTNYALTGTPVGVVQQTGTTVGHVGVTDGDLHGPSVSAVAANTAGEAVSSTGRVFVGASRGTIYDIPEGWVGRAALMRWVAV